MIITLKILTLAILFVSSGGILFPNRFRNHRTILFITAAISVLGTTFLFRDLYFDLVGDVAKEIRLSEKMPANNLDNKNEINVAPDANDISIIAFETFDQDIEKLGNNVFRRGGHFMINKTNVGDFSHCSLNMNYGHSPNDLSNNPRNLLDTIYYFNNLRDDKLFNQDKPATGNYHLKTAYKESKMSPPEKFYLMIDDIFDTEKLGTYWKKISFIQNLQDDKNICFIVVCGNSRTQNKCFPIK